MITSVHALLYAADPAPARGFFRDVLGLPCVDAHDGWLIFRLPPAELGVHPAGAGSTGRQELSLMCDDIEQTVAGLRAKGVEFTGPVEDRGFGRATSLRVPGYGELMLYQPRHATGYDL